jgi:hypothetical protein
MILNNIEKVKEYVGMNTNERIDIFTSHIDHAEHKFIKPVLGKTLYEAVESYATGSDSTTEEKYDRILNYIERASAFFTYMIAIPFFDVVHTRQGFGVVQTQGVAPASKERVAALKQAVTDGAYDAIENLLEILEEHIDEYEEWQASDAYSLQYDYLVHNAKTLTKHTPGYEDRQLFLLLRPFIKDAERIDIVPHLSSEYIDTLKERVKDNDEQVADVAILTDIHAACANFAISRALPSLYTHLSSKGITVPVNSATEISVERLARQFENKAKTYLNLVINYVIENIDQYPLIKESSVYTDREDGFENEEGNGFFVFGQKG